jgi:hypothetical protein
MTEKEHEIMELLVEATNLFARLPEQHEDDAPEWCRAIHELQRIIMCRKTVREVPGFVNNHDKPS